MPFWTFIYNSDKYDEEITKPMILERIQKTIVVQKRLLIFIKLIKNVFCKLGSNEKPIKLKIHI